MGNELKDSSLLIGFTVKVVFDSLANGVLARGLWAQTRKEECDKTAMV
jgi:hypothetical protein